MKALVILSIFVTLFLISNVCSDANDHASCKSGLKVPKHIIRNFLKRIVVRLTTCNDKKSDAQGGGSLDANGQANGSSNANGQGDGGLDGDGQTTGDSTDDEQGDGSLNDSGQKDDADEQEDGGLDSDSQTDDSSNADGQTDGSLNADGQKNDSKAGGGKTEGASGSDANKTKNDANDKDEADDSNDDDSEEDNGLSHNLLCHWCRHTCINQTIINCNSKQNRCFYYHYLDDSVEKGCIIDTNWPQNRARGWTIRNTYICKEDFCNYKNVTV